MGWLVFLEVRVHLRWHLYSVHMCNCTPSAYWSVDTTSVYSEFTSGWHLGQTEISTGGDQRSAIEVSIKWQSGCWLIEYQATSWWHVFYIRSSIPWKQAWGLIFVCIHKRFYLSTPTLCSLYTYVLPRCETTVIQHVGVYWCPWTSLGRSFNVFLGHFKH